MCGIIGQLNFHEPIDREVFDRMRDALTHRGPDGAGTQLCDNGKVALGHRRLSIIDLSEAGAQPMPNEDATLWLTFNGEIYNHAELRVELESLGHTFHSHTDSEVILHGYEAWGMKVLDRLLGMFAFGIWDKKKRTLLLARDRFGIKPLFYYKDGNRLIFSSEVKGIVAHPGVKREVDRAAVCDYLIYRYVPSPKGIFKGLYKVPPACYLEIDGHGKVQTHQYWDLSSAEHYVDPAEAVQKIDEILLDSHRYHLVSDVPVGSLLSGGYDSTAMVYYLNRLKYPTQTFSVGFNGWDKSEHQYAQIVADTFGTDHTFNLLGRESLALVRKLAETYDEPIADISIVPTYVVGFMAGKKVKVVVSGEGADEAFCGYTWQNEFAAKASKFVSGGGEVFGIPPSLNGIAEYGKAMSMGLFGIEQLANVLHPDCAEAIPGDPFWFYRQHYRPEYSPLKSFQYLDVKTFMGELVLTKVDRASMAHSLEVRVPYLDHHLLEYIFNLAPGAYYDPKVKKKMLHDTLQGHVSKEILDRKKQGFVGPDHYYMAFDLYRKELKNGRLVQDKVVKPAAISDLLNNRDHWRLWKLLVLELWWQRWG